MNARLTRFSIPLLRWTLGLVVLFESSRFAFSASAAYLLSKTGLPSWLQPVLGGAEIVAVVLFLVPFTARGGGYLLLVVFALAAFVHILHGQFDVGGLAVYAAAVLVCLAQTQNKPTKVTHGRI